MHRSSPHFQFVQYEYRYSLQSIFGGRNGILLRSEIIIDQLYGYSCTGTQYEYSTVPILCVATVSLQLQLYLGSFCTHVQYSTGTTVVHVRYEYSCTVPRYMYTGTCTNNQGTGTVPSNQCSWQRYRANANSKRHLTMARFLRASILT